jgi:hypothetical protein
MTLRFQRRVRLAPWLHLIFSKSGVSASIGPRGADVNVNRHGIIMNVGITGTGLRDLHFMNDRDADKFFAAAGEPPLRKPRKWFWWIASVVVFIVFVLDAILLYGPFQ